MMLKLNDPAEDTKYMMLRTVTAASRFLLLVAFGSYKIVQASDNFEAAKKILRGGEVQNWESWVSMLDGQGLAVHQALHKLSSF